jgi:hypothetical protein
MCTVCEQTVSRTAESGGRLAPYGSLRHQTRQQHIRVAPARAGRSGHLQEPHSPTPTSNKAIRAPRELLRGIPAVDSAAHVARSFRPVLQVPNGRPIPPLARGLPRRACRASVVASLAGSMHSAGRAESRPGPPRSTSSDVTSPCRRQSGPKAAPTCRTISGGRRVAGSRAAGRLGKPTAVLCWIGSLGDGRTWSVAEALPDGRAATWLCDQGGGCSGRTGSFGRSNASTAMQSLCRNSWGHGPQPELAIVWAPVR